LANLPYLVDGDTCVCQTFLGSDWLNGSEILQVSRDVKGVALFGGLWCLFIVLLGFCSDGWSMVGSLNYFSVAGRLKNPQPLKTDPIIIIVKEPDRTHVFTSGASELAKH
jgi:hypothetical protein